MKAVSLRSAPRRKHVQDPRSNGTGYSSGGSRGRHPGREVSSGPRMRLLCVCFCVCVGGKVAADPGATSVCACVVVLNGGRGGTDPTTEVGWWGSTQL